MSTFIYAPLRSLYRALDKLLLSRLQLRQQLAMKGAVLHLVRALFPSRLLVTSASQLVSNRHATDQSWSWKPPALPQWVRDEMDALALIDPSLHSQGDLLREATFYSAPWCNDKPGKVYGSLRRALKEPVDVVIAVPWLKTGGADLGAIHVANALADELGQRVLVLATEASASPWAKRLSPKVQFIAAGDSLASIEPDYRLDVLVRFLLQLTPRVFHVMNSVLAWKVVARNGLALRQSMKLYASLYCDDFTPSGLPVGYARDYLPRCYHMLEAVISDNSQTWRAWVKDMGVPSSLFRVLPFPAPAVKSTRSGSANGKALLWAGRLDRQKRPDLLARLAAALPDFRFDVYGAAVLDQENLEGLRKLSNVRMCGAYERFSELVTTDHLAFVYTTAWDGLPNVLLEAAAAGLPIVAPNVGGISDFIPAADLVATGEDLTGYVNAIQVLASDTVRRASQCRALREQLAQRCWAVFVENLRCLNGYVAPPLADMPRDIVKMSPKRESGLA